MNVYIGSLSAAILLVGIVVGCFVYKHTRTSSGHGDIVGAIASAAAVITVLALLLGGGTKTTSDGERPARDASITTAR